MKRKPIYLLACALLAWLLCFFLLAHGETWAPFAAAGVLLVCVGIWHDVVSVKAVGFSLKRAAMGLGAGLAMVLLTHAGYALLAGQVPGLGPATKTLLTLLDVTGSSLPVRGALIVIIAGSEEILFRGSLGEDAISQGAPRTLGVAHAHVLRTLALAGAYALTTVPLMSPLLLLVAFVCGSIWGFLRLATNSLTVPIVTHVIWDLGVLLVWPLPN